MPNIYDGISKYYEKWSTGDEAYEKTYKFYTSALKQMAGGRYLELGIGTGRISLDVIQHVPIHVVGIDESEKMLNICYNKYRNQKSCLGELELCRGNFINLHYESDFDGAIMPFRTIGHILNDTDILSMFNGVYRALKPGGWFLLDHYIINSSWAQSHNDKKIPMYQDHETVIFDKYHYNFNECTLQCEVTVNSEVKTSFLFRWFNADTLRCLIIKSGFQIISLMGDFDGSQWQEDSENQIWLVRKPGKATKYGMPSF